jgi:hypothetical protein
VVVFSVGFVCVTLGYSATNVVMGVWCQGKLLMCQFGRLMLGE